MYYSLFEIFAVGIGPSSSHTVGPMKAACRYVGNLREQGLLAQTAAVKTELYGSLALTGRGHGTLNAVVYGLLGLKAEEVDPETDYIGRENWRSAEKRQFRSTWRKTSFSTKRPFCPNIPTA